MTDTDKMREDFGKWLVQRRLGRFADFNGNLIDCTAVFWEAWQAAKSVPVVGDVLFYASDSTPTAESQIQYDVCAYQKDYSFFPVYRKPTNSITADELERLRKDAERYKWLKSHANIIDWRTEDEEGVRTHSRPTLDSDIDSAMERNK